jgi:hypothetical protein
MSFIRYITYLLYSYYSKGARRNVAYVSAILGITFLIYIQLFIVALLFHVDTYIPMSLSDSKGSRYIKLMLILSPVFFLLYFGIKERSLEKLKEDLGYEYYDKEVGHRNLLFLYLVASFVSLLILAVLRRT